ncbi:MULTISPECIES: flavoprotein [Streptomyces]|uniref:flavoprotein n=1 Tax=Streptomyces TaxID=1883 RepID=UPI002248EC63|nr:flavoprotein [Streptomyces sp. JHD 1]MCX2967854.1 flavoprotein [Streptomyces sp. JHD 1]
MTRGVLYLLGCAAPPVQYVDRAVRAAQADGWEVCLGLTPTAAEWTADRLPEWAELTGHPVRTDRRRPWEASEWPPPTVSVVAPATLNTVNAVALGLTPTWLAGHAVEALGKGWPLVVMPCVSVEYGSHPQLARSVEVLRGAGVRVLYGAPDGFVPRPAGGNRAEEYPWHLALDAVRAGPGGSGGGPGGAVPGDGVDAGGRGR